MKRTAHYSRAAALLLAALSVTPALSQDEPFTREVEARALTLVNDLRAGNGLAPLQREPRLDASAAYFAGYISRAARLDHRADGNTPATRVRQRGYAYCNISENIAMEYSSRGFSVEGLTRRLVDGWRGSPSHRANLLDPYVTETGFGLARNAQGEYYAVQVFARPPPRGQKGCR